MAGQGRRFNPPIGSVLFSAQGKIEKLLEPIAGDKPTAELQIAHLFALSLEIFYGRVVKDLTNNPKANEVPDVVATENGRMVGIEFAEAVSRRRRHWQTMKHTLGELIMPHLREDIDYFRGIYIGVGVDSYPNVRPQSIKNIDGLAREIASEVKSHRGGMASLPIGVRAVFFSGSTFPNDERPSFSVSFCRLGLSSTPGSMCEVHVGGSYCIGDDDSSAFQDVLSRKLRLKMDFTHLRSNILVIYQLGYLVSKDYSQLESAAHLIKRRNPSFTEIWSFDPGPGKSGGILIRLWPLPLEVKGMVIPKAANDKPRKKALASYAWGADDSDLVLPVPVHPEVLAKAFTKMITKIYGRPLQFNKAHSCNRIEFVSESGNKRTIVLFQEIGRVKQYDPQRVTVNDLEIAEHVDITLAWLANVDLNCVDEICLWIRDGVLCQRPRVFLECLRRRLGEPKYHSIRVLHLLCVNPASFVTLGPRMEDFQCPEDRWFVH